jgi:hypothetical protein
MALAAVEDFAEGDAGFGAEDRIDFATARSVLWPVTQTGPSPPSKAPQNEIASVTSPSADVSPRGHRDPCPDWDLSMCRRHPAAEAGRGDLAYEVFLHAPSDG